MRPVTRFFVPVLCALLLGAGVIGVLAWQVSTSTARLRAELSRIDTPVTSTTIMDSTSSQETADSGDKALLALRRGDLLSLQAQWADAEVAYREAVDNGGGMTALKKLAVTLLQRRKYDEVTTMIADLQAKGMRAEDVLLLQAIVLMHTGKTQGAVQLVTPAPDSPQKHYVLALVAIIRGQTDTAKTELQSVLDGWDPQLRENAKALLDAYDQYAKFPESTNVHLSTLVARGLAIVRECELALPILGSVLTQQPDYRDALTLNGYCQLVTERLDAALQSLQRAYEIDPEKPEIQYFMGRTYAALGDTENAMTFLQYALKNGLNPEKEGRKSLAAIAAKAGRSDVALEQLRAVAVAPDSAREDIFAFADAAIAAKKIPDAITVVRTAIAKWPGDSGLQMLFGKLLLAEGNRADAKAAFQKAFALDPTNIDAKTQMSKL